MSLKNTNHAIKTAVLIFLLGLALSASAHNKVVVIPLGSDVAPLKNVVTVSDKNGDFGSISAAIASITDSSEGNQYLVFVGPGNFAPIEDQLVIPPFVSLVGSGRHQTKLFSNVSASGTSDVNLQSAATVVLSAGASISNLTVEVSNGDDETSVGILVLDALVNPESGNLIDNVHIQMGAVFGFPKLFGVVGVNGLGTVTNSSITIKNGSETHGVLATGGVLEMHETRVEVEGATVNNTAAEDSNVGAGALHIQNSKLSAKGTVSTGIIIDNPATKITQVEVNGVTANVSDNEPSVKNCLDVFDSSLNFLGSC